MDGLRGLADARATDLWLLVISRCGGLAVDPGATTVAIGDPNGPPANSNATSYHFGVVGSPLTGTRVASSTVPPSGGSETWTAAPESGVHVP